MCFPRTLRNNLKHPMVSSYVREAFQSNMFFWFQCIDTKHRSHNPRYFSGRHSWTDAQFLFSKLYGVCVGIVFRTRVCRIGKLSCCDLVDNDRLVYTQVKSCPKFVSEDEWFSTNMYLGSRVNKTLPYIFACSVLPLLWSDLLCSAARPHYHFVCGSCPSPSPSSLISDPSSYTLDR